MHCECYPRSGKGKAGKGSADDCDLQCLDECMETPAPVDPPVAAPVTSEDSPTTTSDDTPTTTSDDTPSSPTTSDDSPTTSSDDSPTSGSGKGSSGSGSGKGGCQNKHGNNEAFEKLQHGAKKQRSAHRGR